MDPKELSSHPLLAPGGQPRPQRAAQHVRRRRTLLFTTLLAVLALTQVPLRKHAQTRRGASHAGGPYAYEGESVAWEACGDVDGRPVECSTLSVPMDQFNASNAGDKVFTIPLIRMRGKNATQNLLLNPGGPGGSGAEFLFQRGEQLSAIVGEGLHLLSFDPRGIGQSRPLASCYADRDARQALGRVRTERVVEDSPEAYAWATNFVRACADNMGEHGLYVNTPQTAADMNSILDAVGQADLFYWGFSYGTLLGQTYAGLFPERSQRVLIDGVLNQFDWYNELTTSEQLTDTERVLDGFFDECVKAGADCPLAAVAESKEELRDMVLGLADSLYVEPLSVYVNATAWGPLDYFQLMFHAVFPTLYKPATWYDLADRLAKLLEGNATDFFLGYVSTPQPWDAMLASGEGNCFVTMNDGKSGPDFWPRDRATALKNIMEPFAHGSLFAPTFNKDWSVKQHWALPRTHAYEPQLGVETAHPLLILSTTYDPICPLVAAHSAQRAFAGSQIVEVKGYGHCSLAVASACAARHVRAFLYNGTVPARYTQCEVDGPYFVKPGDDGRGGGGGGSFGAWSESEAPPRIGGFVRPSWKRARDAAWPLWQPR